MKPNFGESFPGQGRKPAENTGKKFNYEEVLARAKEIAEQRKKSGTDSVNSQSGAEGERY